MTCEEAKLNFIVLDSLETLQSFRQGIESYLELVEYPLSKDYADAVLNTLFTLREKYHKLGKSSSSRKQWIEAFKAHKSRVSEICSQIISTSVITGIANPIVSVRRSKISFSNGFDLEEEKIYPRAFWKAYHLFSYAIFCETASQLKAVLRVITTVFSTCKDFRMSPSEQDEDVLQQIFEIQDKVIAPIGDIDWEKEILETLELISKEVNGERVKGSPAFHSFCSTIKRVKQNFSRPELTPDKLKRSSASSGMSLGRITIPGHVASMFEGNLDTEFDYSKFDTLTGYSFKEMPKSLIKKLRLKVTRNKSVAIEQKKFAMRLIHILANQFQDRLQFVEEIHKALLFSLPSDATKNQMKGQIALIKWMRNLAIQVLNSLDMHAATNTMSLSWQGKVTEYLLQWFDFQDDEIRIIMEVWYHIMGFETCIRLPGSKKVIHFKFSSGQPMGYHDSFMSFATLHHVVDLTVERVSEIEQVGYRIVGDDFANAIKKDPTQKFARYYQACMAFLNVECNLDKGYIFNNDIPGKTLRIAEFAKCLICEGFDISPLPLGALSKFNQFGSKLTLLSWLTLHDESLRGSITFDHVFRFCHASDSERIAIALLARIPVKNIFKSDKSPLNMRLMADYQHPAICICAATAFIKQSILLTTLAEVNRNPEYVPKVSDYKSFYGNYKKIRGLIQKMDDPEYAEYMENNKFYHWFKGLELLAQTQSLAVKNMLEGIIPGQDIIDVLPCISRLNDDKLERLIELSKFWSEINQELDNESREINTDYLDEEIAALLAMLEELCIFEFDSTNHRFGSGSDRASQGFDVDLFLKDTKRNLKNLGINDEEFNLYISEINALKDSEFYPWIEPWETYEIDPEEINALSNTDCEEDDNPWDLL